MAKSDFGYIDLSFNPGINNLGDITTVTDRQAIKQSLTNIVNTGRGQRLMEPNFGAGVERFLFEPLDERTGMDIGKAIEYNIKTYEPRITLISVNVKIDWVNNGYDISVRYSINDLQDTDFLEVKLEKI